MNISNVLRLFLLLCFVLHCTLAFDNLSKLKISSLLGIKNFSFSKGSNKLPHEAPEHDFAMNAHLHRLAAQAPKHPSETNFFHGFVASLSVIIVSELGDKTFFIAAIMAMRYSRLTVFIGAMLALILMHCISAIMGYATTVIPRKLTFYISSALFAFFGLKMLKEGYLMRKEEAQEEFEEVQADLRKREETLASGYDIEAGATSSAWSMSRLFPCKDKLTSIYMLFSRIFLESFTLTFLAEWGDRSQITTIILAARENVFGVILGGALGHALCTGLAVLGGRFIAQRISVRTVTLIGGMVFILFALSAIVMGP